MKIVFFDFVTHYGGAPQLVVSTAKRLRAEDDVEVVDVYGTCQDYIRVLKDAGIKTRILVPEARSTYVGYRHSKIQRFWCTILQVPVFGRIRKRLTRAILEINPDVVWVYSPKALLFLKFNFGLRRYPVVMYATGCPDALLLPWWYRWVIRSRPNVVMAISTETVRQLRLMGVKAGRIKLVFESIDFAEILDRSRAALESPLPGLDGSPRIFLPATLLHAKGQHTAVKAVSRLKEQGFNPTLWLAGDSAPEDEPYVRYLHELVEERRVSSNVYFLGWRRDVPAIIVQSDIVILPTHTEGFGRVALEAMVLHRPAVTTPVGGMKDLIQDGKDGLFFPVDDDEALARHLARLAKDGEFASELTKNGYKKATEEFNPEQHTQRVRSALASAVKLFSK